MQYRSPETLTLRTRIVAGIGLVAFLSVYLPVLFRVGGEKTAALVSNIGEPIVFLLVAVFTIVVAFGFAAAEPARWHWGFIGFGVLAYALGDIVWASYEVVAGTPAPYPGPADILYLETYPLMAAGMLGAAYSLRWLSNVRSATIISYSLAGAASLVLYATLLRHIVHDPAVGVGTKILAVAYPFGDIFLLAAPALLLVIALRPFSARVLAWPWLLASAGALIWAAADTAFVYLDWQGQYASGHPIDGGWVLGAVLIGVAASIARDVYLLTDPS